ncbi:hypothetical protein GC170_19010 [bacterium]|nr:hypothetical protein [bacterium]
MPLLKKCTRCGTVLLWPVVIDGKCFCSPECELLYDKPEILAEIPPFEPGIIRLRAFVLFVFSLIPCAYLIWYQSKNAQWIHGPGKKGFTIVFLPPFVFMAQLIIGAPLLHLNLVFMSKPGWKRALIILAILAMGVAMLAGGFSLYYVLNRTALT